MAQDVLNVFAGRNMRLNTQPWLTGGIDFPADTIDWAGDLSDQWADAGFTNGGMNLTNNQPRTDIRVDQLVDAVRRIVNSRALAVSADLSEITADNYAIAFGNGEVTPTAATSGVRGNNQLDLDNVLAEVYESVLLDIEGPDLEALRIMVWMGLQTGNMNNQFRDTAAALLHLEYSALPDTSTTPTQVLAIRRVTPALP